MAIFSEPIPEVADFLNDLDHALSSLPGGKHLSSLQRHWIGFCITGIIVTHTLCWECFERGSAGYYKAKALSFMLHWAPIPWEKLLMASTLLLLRLYKVTSGILAIDDTNRPRSKAVKRLFGVHKVKDKKTNGYVMAQCLVRMVLVTQTITVPVGVEFYRPDPRVRAWRENDKRLRKQGVAKASRPAKPEPRRQYPSKQQIATRLLRRFQYRVGGRVRIMAITADAAYMSKFFSTECARVYPGIQVISQLRCNQLVSDGRRPRQSLEAYFANCHAQRIDVRRRGTDGVTIFMTSARLRVKAMGGRKMLIVAMKYEGDEKYRYLVGTDLTWRSLDVVKAYSYRWLVEVEIEDWKVYEGGGKGACQQGEDGARRGLCLSMLVDHALLHHPKQLHLARTGQPLQTVGTLMHQLQVNCLLQKIESILDSQDPKAALQEFADQLSEVVVIRPSDKHMSGRVFDDLGPTPSLQHRFANTS